MTQKYNDEISTKRLSGYLKVTGGPSVYWEQHGNLKGQPVIILHGGPGGGMQRKHLES
jgi:proline iminopeptidase